MILHWEQDSPILHCTHHLIFFCSQECINNMFSPGHMTAPPRATLHPHAWRNALPHHAACTSLKYLTVSPNLNSYTLNSTMLISQCNAMRAWHDFTKHCVLPAWSEITSYTAVQYLAIPCTLPRIAFVWPATTAELLRCNELEVR